MNKKMNDDQQKDINIKEIMNFLSKNKFLSAVMGNKILKSAARRPLRTLGVAIAIGCISSLIFKSKKNKNH